MRRVYLDLLLRRLARGDVSFPARALRSLWAVRRGRAQPILGTLIVTYRCDLDCAMCDLPLRGNRGRELDADGLKGVLEAFRDLGVLGVGVTGGEPLLRKDLFDVLRHGRDLGMLMHVNTNGSLVTPETAEALASSGVSSVNVSLDGPEGALHDRLRGREGSYRRVLRAVARLAAVPGRPYRIALTCALGRENAGEARSLLERGRDLGADRVGFIPVHDFPAVGVRAGVDERPLEALLERCGVDPVLDNSREYLRLFGAAYGGERNPVACSAPRTSVVVDCYGEAYPCVPLNAARRPVGAGDVRTLWRSEAYKRVRESLAGCRACFWNCHTELNLALGKLGTKP